MDYPVQCQCGAVRLVPEERAGTSLRCPCGSTIAVPDLADLRSGAGARMGPPTPEKTIVNGVDSGRLPPEHCATCGSAATKLLQYEAICEKSFVGSSGTNGFVECLLIGFGWLVGGMVGAAFATVPREEQTMLGRDLVVPVPIRLCHSCGIYRVPGHSHVMALLLAGVAFVLACFLAFRDGLFALGALAAAVILLMVGVNRARARRDSLIALLSHVQPYAELFERFPDAAVRKKPRYS